MTHSSSLATKLIKAGLAVCTLLLAVTVPADDLKDLAGKWSVQKKNDQGQAYTQTLEVKNNKFIFNILGEDGNVTIYAEGDFKVEKLGSFKAAKFFNIKGGQSASDALPIDEEYASVYVLNEDGWTVASNFDKDRNRKPGIDIYKRLKDDAPATLVIDKIEMAQTPQTAAWFICFEAAVNGVKQKYFLPNKGYDKTPVTIPLAISLPKFRKGQTCSFVSQLDDVEDDVCTDEIDNKSTGTFTISESGSQTFKPEDTWRYTIYWHLKASESK